MDCKAAMSVTFKEHCGSLKFGTSAAEIHTAFWFMKSQLCSQASQLFLLGYFSLQTAAHYLQLASMECNPCVMKELIPWGGGGVVLHICQCLITAESSLSFYLLIRHSCQLDPNHFAASKAHTRIHTPLSKDTLLMTTENRLLPTLEEMFCLTITPN